MLRLVHVFISNNTVFNFAVKGFKVNAISIFKPLVYLFQRPKFGRKRLVYKPRNISRSVTGETVKNLLFQREASRGIRLSVYGTAELYIIFSLCWRYPGFFYKNLPRQNFYKGIYYLGSFGTGTHYPDNSWIKPGAHLVERSGRWRHVAAVFDQGIVRIYLDGKLSVERTAEKGNLLAANDRPFYIAAQRVTGENANLVTADMLLNDLRLYGKALSEAEIKKIIASETAKYPKGDLIPKGETHLNALPDCWAYLPAQYDVEMKKILPVTAEYEKNMPKPADFSKGIKAERKVVNGLPALFINGEMQTPVQGNPNLRHQLTHKFLFHKYNMGIRNFAAAGIELLSVGASPSLFWKGDRQYDWKVLDDIFARAIKANPN